ASVDFPQPKIQQLRKTSRFVSAYSVLVTAAVGFLFVWLVPSAERGGWRDVPLAGIVLAVGAPLRIGPLLVTAVAFGSSLFLTLAIRRTAGSRQQLLLRLSEDGVLSPKMRTLHPRFGTPSRLIDLAAVAQLAILTASAGQLAWIASAYGIAVVCSATLQIAALIRLRVLRPEPRAFRVPFNVQFAGRERPVGLVLIAALLAIPALMLVLSGDPAAMAGIGLLVAFALALRASEQAYLSSSAAETASFHEIAL